MKRFATFLSYLLHPILSPLISIYILFHLPIYQNYRLSEEYFNFIYLVILINLILIPLTVSFYLKDKGYIASLKMETTKERRIPFLVSSVLYVITFFVFQTIGFPEIYLQIFMAATWVVLILSVLSFFNVKWSAHLSAMGGLLGMLIVVTQTYNLNLTVILIFFILLSGALASARLVLNAHTQKELLFGFSLGLVAQLILLI
tara:strand:+ start:2319 stop:2924 length:606 start_codon:yes stop_codon:yes gene_type:complete